jgi:hypothetical protein
MDFSFFDFSPVQIASGGGGPDTLGGTSSGLHLLVILVALVSIAALLGTGLLFWNKRRRVGK